MADNAPPKKKSKLKWFLLLILLLLIGGGVAGAWFFFLQEKLFPAAGSNQAEQVEKVEVRASSPAGISVPLPVFTTNLADPLGQRFIKINLVIEVADDRVQTELTQQDARVRDSILLLLSSKTYADVASPESKLLLKSEITDRLNTILGPGKIHQVFITDWVIQ